MLAHQGGDASALGLPRNDVPAIADMGTKAGLIGLDEVGPDNPSTGLVSYRCRCRRLNPGLVNLCFGTLREKCVRITHQESGVQDGPDRCPVRFLVLTDVVDR